ncbi:unnamed protein product [Rodentolepis nana]|uniref:Uncharacterized protein n=1 Tax=Rodentolepis nana TaxID=102285 RepID=A0A0R3TTL5_RODNA|nr:unnamed protein product [Rodentolepis nana]
MREGKMERLQRKVRKRMQLNRICWLNLAQYHAIRLAIESRSPEEMICTLGVYNYITKFITKLSYRNVNDGPLVKVLMCGVNLTPKLTEKLNKTVGNAFEENAIMKSYMRVVIGVNVSFAELINSPRSIPEPDVFIFVSNMSEDFGGWGGERAFFREATSYFLNVHMPHCVFVLDAKIGANFERLIKLFRKFVPSAARCYQPCLQNKTHFKVWQLRRKEGVFANLVKILIEAFSVCYFRKVGDRLFIYWPAPDIPEQNTTPANQS